MSTQEKLQQFFEPMSLYKKEASSLFASLSLPAFIRDYIVKKYANQDGTYDINLIAEKVKELIPDKTSWPLLLDEIILNSGTVTFLAKLKININLTEGYVSFAMPDLDVDFDSTVVSDFAWKKIKEEKVSLDSEFWGVVTLNKMEYVQGKKTLRKINLKKFTAFKPYRLDANYFCNIRKEFSIEEWIELVLGAMDYNASSFADEEERLTMISRLLPFAQKRLNLIELAPKGTGKSYVFSRLSKYVWLNSGGVMTRAKLFYDMRYHMVGLIGNYDVVALDEIKTIRFPDMNEMQGALKGYLENGEFAVGTKKTIADAGMVFLGNIKEADMDTNVDMFSELPMIFRDSALLDRIHGFIRGWDIPRMSESMKVTGLSLNSEYFTEMLHLFRNDSVYDHLVDELLEEVDGDTRDISAVKRIATAYLKILFPHYRKVLDVDLDLFDKYCLSRAIRMRQDIKNQLCLLDSEFKKVKMPEFKLKGRN